MERQGFSKSQTGAHIDSIKYVGPGTKVLLKAQASHESDSLSLVLEKFHWAYIWAWRQASGPKIRPSQYHLRLKYQC